MRRIRRALGLEPPSREEIRLRVRSKPSIFDSMSPETREYLRNYDGPEHLGPPAGQRKRGILARLRAWLLDEVTTEEARQRLQGKSGYLASRSPEALEHMWNYDGPEVHGPPLTRRERRDLERRTAARDQSR